MNAKHTPWRKKTDGNIGHAIEAQVIPPSTDHGYADDGYRIVCTYQGHFKNTEGLSEDDHAEKLGDVIVLSVNGHDALVAAVRVASQLAEIASDWNLTEVAIDGQMVSTYDLKRAFDAALTAAGETP